MKVKNPTGRPIIATMFGTNREDQETHVVEAGETVEVDDYVVGATLIEYGCTADPVEIQAARQAWAAGAREVNSRAASASASEGELLRRQATVSVADGTVDDLKGQALDDAVDAANAEGAEIPKSGKADEKRAALRDWQANRPAVGEPVDAAFLVDGDGELLLDDEGQPYPADEYVLDDEGKPVPAKGKRQTG